MTIPDLRALVASAQPADLPALLGELEAAKAVAWARLTIPNAPPTIRDENLDIREASRRLNMSKRWLYTHHKTLPFARRIGRRVLFSARGLERWNRQKTA